MPKAISSRWSRRALLWSWHLNKVSKAKRNQALQIQGTEHSLRKGQAVPLRWELATCTADTGRAGWGRAQRRGRGRSPRNPDSG